MPAASMPEMAASTKNAWLKGNALKTLGPVEKP